MTKNSAIKAAVIPWSRSSSPTCAPTNSILFKENSLFSLTELIILLLINDSF
jgi:hypothetical protein